jgi:hypothetical protein
MMIHDLANALALFAPCLALAVAVLAGRFPGERRLVRAMEQPTAQRRHAVHSSVRCVCAAPRPRIGGGLLLARALAGRAPPWVPSCAL